MHHFKLWVWDRQTERWTDRQMDGQQLCAMPLFTSLIIRPVLCTYMQPIITDQVAWSVGRVVCLSVTIVSPAETAQPIAMLFELRTWVGQRNHVLDGIQISTLEGIILRGKHVAHCKV